MENTYTKLRDLRKTEVHDKFIEKTKEKCEEIGLENPDYPLNESLRKCLERGLTASDMQMSPKDKHRIEYFCILDGMSNEYSNVIMKLKKSMKHLDFLNARSLKTFII